MKNQGIGFDKKTKRYRKAGNPIKFRLGETIGGTIPKVKTTINPRPNIQNPFPKVADELAIKNYVMAVTGTLQIEKKPEVTICYLWQKNYRPSPIIPVSVDKGPPRQAMIDTGASITLISYSGYHEISKHWTSEELIMRRRFRLPRVFGVSGAELRVIGKFILYAKIGDMVFPHPIVVIKAGGEEYYPSLHRIDMIIGMDFLRRFQIKMSFGQIGRQGIYDEITIGHQTFKTKNVYDAHTDKYIGAVRIKPMKALPPPTEEEEFISVAYTVDFIILPYSIMWIRVRIIEEVDTQGRILTQQLMPGIIILGGEWEQFPGILKLLLLNINPGPLENEQGEEIEVCQSKEPDLEFGDQVAQIGALNTDIIEPQTREQRWQEMMETVVKQATTLNEVEKDRLRKLILKHKARFGLKDEPPGLVPNFEINVELLNTEPITIHQYRLPNAVQEEIQSQTEEMLKYGVIKESKSRWNFPIVPVPKKIISNEGVEKTTLRPCMDLRPLNKPEVTKIIFFTIPTVESTLSSLHGSCYFSSFDILAAFWHLPLKPEHCEYFAYSTHRGHYEYNRMPFGWVNSPFYFQQYAQTRIANPHPEYTQVYIDDIMIHSKNKEKHFHQLNQVLDTIEDENIILKLSKCAFFQPELEYLGHIVSKDGIRKDPKKVAAILKAETPKNKKEVRRILGKCNYYGPYLWDLARIADPLFALTSQSDKVKFVWEAKHEAAFRQLLDMIAQDVTLKLPDPNKLYTITTDASEHGVGGCLSQKDEETGLERPVMFISAKFTDAQKRYTVTEKELYAIIYALRKFKPYIYGRKFDIVTDHRALIWLCGKRDPTSRLGRWSQIISEYAQNVRYIQGKNNKVADALSRAPFVNEEEFPSMDKYNSNPHISKEAKEMIAKSVGINLDKLQEDEFMTWQQAHYELANSLLKRAKDEQAQLKLKPGTVEVKPDPEADISENEGIESTDALIAALHYSQTEYDDRELLPTMTPELWGKQIEPQDIPNYIQQDPITKVLTYKRQPGILWVPHKYRRQVLKTFHYIPHAAHPSGDKMEMEIRRVMNWMNLKDDVREWVKTCPHCQLFRRGVDTKPEMQNRRLPQYPMQRISMDFVSLESATESGDHRILVIVDELTRYAEALVVPNEKGNTAADVLMKNIVCRYGVPEEIISDQGSGFISDLFETMCYQIGVDKVFTTAYHPQGNGINERMHGTLYTILRSMTGKTPQAWKKQLPYALFIYRTSHHKSINMSPHKALYGYQPKHVALEMLPTDDYFPLDKRIKTLVKIHEDCREFLEKQQGVRNERINRERETPQYEPGDWVKLRIHERANKLSPFWKGPFQILRKVNPVNYEVDFPQYQNQSRIIHVQHIKPWHSRREDGLDFPESGSISEKATKRERKQDQVQNRPITRAYAKLLNETNKAKEEIKPIAGIWDEENDVVLEYCWPSEIEDNNISNSDTHLNIVSGNENKRK